MCFYFLTSPLLSRISFYLTPLGASLTFSPRGASCLTIVPREASCLTIVPRGVSLTFSPQGASLTFSLGEPRLPFPSGSLPVEILLMLFTLHVHRERQSGRRLYSWFTSRLCLLYTCSVVCRCGCESLCKCEQKKKKNAWAALTSLSDRYQRNCNEIWIELKLCSLF